MIGVKFSCEHAAFALLMFASQSSPLVRSWKFKICIGSSAALNQTYSNSNYMENRNQTSPTFPLKKGTWTINNKKAHSASRNTAVYDIPSWTDRPTAVSARDILRLRESWFASQMFLHVSSFPSLSPHLLSRSMKVGDKWRKGDVFLSIGTHPSSWLGNVWDASNEKNSSQIV